MQRRPRKGYGEALDFLYSDRKNQFDMKVAGTGRSSILRKGCHVPREDEEQFKAVIWLTNKNIPFYHIPNGGFRRLEEAVKFKRLGVRPGVPDICIPVARDMDGKSYHGLYIELKRVSGGTLSDAQRYWLEELAKQGYATHVAKGADALIDYVRKYLGMVDNVDDGC